MRESLHRPPRISGLTWDDAGALVVRVAQEHGRRLPLHQPGRPLAQSTPPVHSAVMSCSRRSAGSIYRGVAAGLLVALVVLVPLAPAASARTWSVRPDGTGDVTTIAAGLDSSAVGDTVRIACATYHEHDLEVTRGVVLMSETGLPECVTIDAQGTGRVLHLAATGSTPVVRGVTIRGGANGGILVGGGHSAVLVDVAVLSNAPSGIRGIASSLTLTRCRIQDNLGSGLNTIESTVVATDCEFIGNSAPEGGGALLEQSAPASFTRCRFEGNAATSSSMRGGGALVDGAWGATVRFDDCTFTGNSSQTVGGAVAVDGECHARFTGCTVSGNTAHAGGGVSCQPYFGSVTLESTAIIGNLATVGRGGGVSTGSTSALRNCTITGNRAATGGGLAVYSLTTVDKCVLWGNCALDGTELYVNDQFPRGTVTFSCSVVYIYSGWRAGGGIVDWTLLSYYRDPLFCDPADCEDVPTAAGDYSVGAGSPCLAEESGSCGLIGAFGQGTCSTAVRPTSWGRLKATFR